MYICVVSIDFGRRHAARSICQALKGKLVYKNVLKLLPQNSKGVNTARAQLKKVFHEMATGRRKLVAGLDAILFGIVSYRSGLEKAIECMNNMFIPQTELNKMELLVLTMAVRSPAVGPAKLCELWSDHFKSLCTEQHAMMLAWVSTRKEAMEWTKAMSPGSSIVSWFRNWQLYGKFRRDYELPLLKLRIKSLKCAAHPASQGNTSGMGTCFCLGGALGINGEEGSPDVESVHRASGSMSSLSSNYPASRMPRALQASSSAPDLMSSQRVTRMSNDAQAQRFSDSYRELSKIIDGGSKSTCATSLATSSVSTASSQENVKHTSTHEKITHTLAVSDETAGDAGSQDIHDNMEVHRRSMIEKIGELSKQLSESHLTQTEGSGACPPAVFTLNRNSDTAA